MRTTPTDLNTLLAAVGFLMTRYVQCRSPETARGVVHQLEMLLAHPQLMASPAALHTYQALLLRWRTILSRHETATAGERLRDAPWVH